MKAVGECDGACPAYRAIRCFFTIFPILELINDRYALPPCMYPCFHPDGLLNHAKGPELRRGRQEKAVKVTQTARGAEITSDERILFDTGKSDIKQEVLVLLIEGMD